MFALLALDFSLMYEETFPPFIQVKKEWELILFQLHKWNETFNLMQIIKLSVFSHDGRLALGWVSIFRGLVVRLSLHYCFSGLRTPSRVPPTTGPQLAFLNNDSQQGQL